MRYSGAMGGDARSGDRDRTRTADTLRDWRRAIAALEEAQEALTAATSKLASDEQAAQAAEATVEAAREVMEGARAVLEAATQAEASARATVDAIRTAADRSVVDLADRASHREEAQGLEQEAHERHLATQRDAYERHGRTPPRDSG